jgi:hypothetical protein
MTRALLAVSVVYLGCGGGRSQTDAGSDGAKDLIAQGGSGGGDNTEAGGDDGSDAEGQGGAGGGAGSSSDGPDDQGGTDAISDAPIDMGFDMGFDGIPGVGCPDTFPTSPGTCSPPGLLCTYGTAARPECRDRASCNGGAWLLIASQCPTPASADACPPTPPVASGTVGCPGGMVSQICSYPDVANGVECKCTGDPATMGVYQCARFPTPPAPCPPKLPNSGSACDAALQGVSCNYPCVGNQVTNFGARATCNAGAWTWAPLTSC